MFRLLSSMMCDFRFFFCFCTRKLYSFHTMKKIISCFELHIYSIDYHRARVFCTNRNLAMNCNHDDKDWCPPHTCSGQYDTIDTRSPMSIGERIERQRCWCYSTTGWIRIQYQFHISTWKRDDTKWIGMF
jgi:hypothetical protein